MKRLDDYLSKFKNLRPPVRSVKKVCIEAIQEECDITLRSHELSVNGGVVFITTNPIIKSEIMIKKGILLQRIKRKTLGIPISEIR